MPLRFLTTSLVCIALAGAAIAEDWPQWRGPQRDGVSRETGLLPSWPAEGPTLLWQVNEIGDGYSTPAVVGNRMYLLTNIGLENELVQCRDAENGNEIWSKRIGKVGNPNQRPPYPGARSTPTVVEDVLYALGSDGDLVCMSVADGAIRWHKQIREEFDGAPGEWAYSESPLVDGDAVICTPGGSKATIVAFNKQSGDVLWKSAIPGGDEAGYASPIVVEDQGPRQYVQFLAKGVVGVDAKTGKLLWRYGKTAEGSRANIPTPIEQAGYVYTAAGRSGGGLVKLTSAGGKIDAKEVYYSPKLPRAIGGSVVVGDHLYGSGEQGLICADFKTGEIAWTDRSIGACSLCYADGRLYLHGDDNNSVALVEATPEGYRELGRFTPKDGPELGRSKAWAYPVVANGRLYIRNLGSLWAYDIRR